MFKAYYGKSIRKEGRNKILTAAEFLGKKNSFLEASRKQLFIENPLSKEFEKWMKKSITTKKHFKPPI